MKKSPLKFSVGTNPTQMRSYDNFSKDVKLMVATCLTLMNRVRENNLVPNLEVIPIPPSTFKFIVKQFSPTFHAVRKIKMYDENTKNKVQFIDYNNNELELRKMIPANLFAMTQEQCYDALDCIKNSFSVEEALTKLTAKHSILISPSGTTEHKMTYQVFCDIKYRMMLQEISQTFYTTLSNEAESE